MKARNKVEDRIVESEALFFKVSTNYPDLNYPCLYISLKALGGAVHLNNILLDTKDQIVFWNDGLNKVGLDLGSYTEIDALTDADTIEEIIEILSSLEDADSIGNLKGLFVTVFSREKDLGHGFVIFPYSTLSRNRAAKLKKQKKYLVLDTADGKPIGRSSAQDLAEYFNEILKIEGHIAIYQIF